MKKGTTRTPGWQPKEIEAQLPLPTKRYSRTSVGIALRGSAEPLRLRYRDLAVTPRAKRTVTHCRTRERATAHHKHTQHVHSLFPCFLVSLFPCFLVSLFPCFLLFFFLLSTRVRLSPEERCNVMGSRVAGSNSIPETVLAQEGAHQNVLNP